MCSFWVSYINQLFVFTGHFNTWQYKNAWNFLLKPWKLEFHYIKKSWETWEFNLGGKVGTLCIKEQAVLSKIKLLCSIWTCIKIKAFKTLIITCFIVLIGFTDRMVAQAEVMLTNQASVIQCYSWGNHGMGHFPLITNKLEISIGHSL